MTSYEVLMPEEKAAPLCSGGSTGSVVDKTVRRQNRYLTADCAVFDCVVLRYDTSVSLL